MFVKANHPTLFTQVTPALPGTDDEFAGGRDSRPHLGQPASSSSGAQASWWTVAAATSGLSSKRGVRPARGVAQRAVGLVNGFVTREFNDGSMSGQLGDDRSERISGVGADNEVGEAAVLPPPQDLLGGRRRVAREYRERVRRA